MTRVGKCPCGETVEHESYPDLGVFAHILEDSPIVCAQCAARRERAKAEHRRRTEAERARRREEWERRLFREQVETALPPALTHWRLDRLDTEGRRHAVEAARRWVQDRVPGLVLLGDVGRGKTSLAAAAAVAWIENHLHDPIPRWMPVTEAVSHLGRVFGDETRERTLRALTTNTGPLILDDLDKAKPSARVAETVFTAVDGCLTHLRPFLVTMNATPAQLAKSWPEEHGKAIASRLNECELHKVTGPDRRLTMLTDGGGGR